MEVPFTQENLPCPSKNERKMAAVYCIIYGTFTNFLDNN